MLEGLWAPPEELVIRLDDPIFAVSDSGNGPLTLHTDGRADSFPGGIEIITRWVDAALVTATKTAQSSTITTYVRLLFVGRGGGLDRLMEVQVPLCGSTRQQTKPLENKTQKVPTQESTSVAS